MLSVSICGLWAAILDMEIADLVNSKLPADRQVSDWSAKYKWWELHANYKTYFPDGKHLKRIESLLFIAGISLLIGIMIAFGLVSPRR